MKSITNQDSRKVFNFSSLSNERQRSLESKFSEIESIYADKISKIEKHKKNFQKHKSESKMRSLSDLKTLQLNQNTTYLDKGKIEIHKLYSSRKSNEKSDESKTAEK